MKVWQVNDCDWWVAKTADEAFAASVDTGCEDHWEKPEEITGDDLDKFTITDEDNRNLKMTFRESLNEVIATGSTKPVFFCSTEY